MADNAIAITAGSGTNIDTRTEATNGNHRQVVVLGDPSTNAGVAPVDATYGLTVDVARQAARSATTDTIAAKLATDAIQNGTTALTPKFVAIAAASSGDNTILSAVTSKKIRVLAMNFVLSAATNVYFKDDTPAVIWGGSTNTANFAANGGIVLPFNPVGWFETASGKALIMNLSGANKAGGSITYVEV